MSLRVSMDCFWANFKQVTIVLGQRSSCIQKFLIKSGLAKRVGLGPMSLLMIIIIIIEKNYCIWVFRRVKQQNILNSSAGSAVAEAAVVKIFFKLINFSPVLT